MEEKSLTEKQNKTSKNKGPFNLNHCTRKTQDMRDQFPKTNEKAIKEILIIIIHVLKHPGDLIRK